MSSEIIALVIADLAKAFIQFAFINARNAGLTAEQIDALWAETKVEFDKNDARTLLGGDQ